MELKKITKQRKIRIENFYYFWRILGETLTGKEYIYYATETQLLKTF